MSMIRIFLLKDKASFASCGISRKMMKRSRKMLIAEAAQLCALILLQGPLYSTSHRFHENGVGRHWKIDISTKAMMYLTEQAIIPYTTLLKFRSGNMQR